MHAIISNAVISRSPVNFFLYLKITKLVHCDDRLMYLVILRKQKADLAT